MQQHRVLFVYHGNICRSTMQPLIIRHINHSNHLAYYLFTAHRGSSTTGQMVRSYDRTPFPPFKRSLDTCRVERQTQLFKLARWERK